MSAYQAQKAIAAYQAARQRLIDEDPDLQDDEAALIECLGPEEGTVHELIGYLVDRIQDTEAMADAVEARIDGLKIRKERFERRAGTDRATITAMMDATSERRVELPHATLTLGKGRPGVTVPDVNVLPPRFVRVTETKAPDKAAILAAIKAGEAVFGAELRNGAPSLTIRGR